MPWAGPAISRRTSSAQRFRGELREQLLGAIRLLDLAQSDHQVRVRVGGRLPLSERPPFARPLSPREETKASRFREADRSAPRGGGREKYVLGVIHGDEVHRVVDLAGSLQTGKLG